MLIVFLQYSDVIQASFFGHIHRDEFRILSPAPSKKEKKSIKDGQYHYICFNSIYLFD